MIPNPKRLHFYEKPMILNPDFFPRKTTKHRKPMILNPKKIKFLQRNRTSITIKHTNESTVVVSSVFKA